MSPTNNLVDNRGTIVDEKILLSRNLADIMSSTIPNIQELLNSFPKPVITTKADGSPVTELDIAISQLIEAVVHQHFPAFTFYSEEKFSEWKFPLVALDPLDGTREYISGNSEWSVSIGLFGQESFEGEGWIYNPVTNEVFAQGKNTFAAKKTYSGEVSRSEWEKGLFTGRGSEKFHIGPKGSIAYKLGRLSQGHTDFVISLRPKNIWDIAGGTNLCHQAGMKFYSQGKEVTSVKNLYEPPLIWCAPELLPELLQLFPS